MATIGDASDNTLVEALCGDRWADALGELWQRHLGLLWNTARAVTRSDDDAADAISDAFTNLAARAADGRLQVRESFRALAVTAVRNAAIGRYRKGQRVEVTDTPIKADRHDEGALPADRFVTSSDSAMVAAAFAGLPERSRTVLWLTAVEGLAPREVAAITGLSANNVAQIASRSRDALRTAWVDQHLTRAAIRRDCAAAQRQLPGAITGQLGVGAQDQLDAHLASCGDCANVRAELTEDTLALRGLITLPLGALAAGGGWLARIPRASKHRARHLRHARRVARFGHIGAHPIATTLAVIAVAAVAVGGVALATDGPAIQSVGPRPEQSPAVVADAPVTTTTIATTAVTTPDVEPGVSVPNSGGSASGVRVMVECADGRQLVLDYMVSDAEMDQLCGTTGSVVYLPLPGQSPSPTPTPGPAPAPTPPPPEPLHITAVQQVRSWIVGTVGVTPADEASCHLDYVLTLSDGRTVSRTNNYPFAGLAGGNYSSTWSSDPEYGAYPSAQSFNYAFYRGVNGVLSGYIC